MVLHAPPKKILAHAINRHYGAAGCVDRLDSGFSDRAFYLHDLLIPHPGEIVAVLPAVGIGCVHNVACRPALLIPG